MSTDMEELLRRSLSERSRSVPPAPDPWTGFAGRERIHRRNRRMTLTGVASVIIVAAALVQTGTVALPDRGDNTSPTVAPAAPSRLLSMPLRGSLADDEEWLDEFQRGVDSVKVVPGQVEGTKWGVIAGNDDTLAVDADGSRVLYAGDVSDRHRLALLAVPFRPPGQPETMGLVWFTGPAGATPDEMRQDGSNGHQIQPAGLTGDVAYWSSTNQVSTVATDVVLVLVPRGAEIQTAPRPRYLADGRVDRPWTDVASSDGSALIRANERDADGRKPYLARVLLDGKVLHPGIIVFDGVYADQEFSDDALAEATARTRGGPVDKQWLRAVLPTVLMDAQLDGQPNVELRVPWFGRVAGKDAAVITLHPPDGGVLVYAVRWTVNRDKTSGNLTGAEGMIDLRLLLPAEGATDRPLAWRAASDPLYGEADPEVVNVLAPAGAAAVEVVAGEKRIPVELDAHGYGTLTLPVDAEAVVRAKDADGDVMGETPVAGPRSPRSSSARLLPGETEETRVVP